VRRIYHVEPELGCRSAGVVGHTIPAFPDLWNMLDSMTIFGRILPSRPGNAGGAVKRMP
jgi:hypothetical protein